MAIQGENQATLEFDLLPLAGVSSGKAFADAPARDVRAVCPSCGYQAFSDSDPLLTKYEGRGECPRCGVIPSNYFKKNEQYSLGRQTVQRKMIVEKKGLGIRAILLLLGVTFGVGIGVFALNASNEVGREMGAPSLARTTPSGEHSASHLSAKMDDSAALKRMVDNYFLNGNGMLNDERLAGMIAEVNDLIRETSDPDVKNAGRKCVDLFAEMKYAGSHQRSAWKEANRGNERVQEVNDDCVRAEEKFNASTADMSGGMLDPLVYNARVELSGACIKRKSEMHAYNRRLINEASAIGSKVSEITRSASMCYVSAGEGGE